MDLRWYTGGCILQIRNKIKIFIEYHKRSLEGYQNGTFEDHHIVPSSILPNFLKFILLYVHLWMYIL